MRLRAGLVALLMLMLSCSRTPPSARLAELVQEYVYTTLSFSPSAATAAGYHVHNGIPLDEQLDSYDEQDLERQRNYLKDFRRRLGRSVNLAALDPEARADYDILKDHVDLALLELQTIESHKHNPTLYVELIGNALFSLYVLEFAPADERYRNICSRMRRIPTLVAQARRGLVDAPELWTQMALRENDGNIDMLVKTLRENCPPSQRLNYERAFAEALRALNEFHAFLRDDLMRRTTDWRLGKDRFAAKFRPALGLNLSPEQVLADAESELAAVRQRMYEIALPLHQKLYPSAASRSDLNTVVREVLNKIAERRATPETYMADAKRDLEEARQFVRQKKSVSLPPRDNLQVIDTPEFMRGIYSVGGFNAAPPLEPRLGAFYWLTPIPPTWEPDRIESKLREYNYYGLKLLTLHEAIPGHYLQFEYANDINPNSRRVLRALYGNGPYIEGWAVYATEMMLDEGYLDHDPQLRLTFLKQQLRMIANAILDIRLHTMGMTDEEALNLMIQQTFQEKEEATAKLVRAKLSSTQLCTYFTGWREWKRLREKVRQARGPSFNLAAFHEQALRAGAVPMPALERILTAPPVAQK